MDPNACLDRWRRAIKDGDEGEAVAASVDLHGWLACGSEFQPRWAPGERARFEAWKPTGDGPWGDADLDRG